MKAVALAALGLLAGPALADTSLELCNEHDSEMRVGVVMHGFRVMRWLQADGWFTIQPGRCRLVVENWVGRRVYLSIATEDPVEGFVLQVYDDVPEAPATLRLDSGDGLLRDEQLYAAERFFCAGSGDFHHTESAVWSCDADESYLFTYVVDVGLDTEYTLTFG